MWLGRRKLKEVCHLLKWFFSSAININPLGSGNLFGPWSFDRCYTLYHLNNCIPMYRVGLASQLKEFFQDKLGSVHNQEPKHLNIISSFVINLQYDFRSSTLPVSQYFYLEKIHEIVRLNRHYTFFNFWHSITLKNHN